MQKNKTDVKISLIFEKTKKFAVSSWSDDSGFRHFFYLEKIRRKAGLLPDFSVAVLVAGYASLQAKICI